MKTFNNLKISKGLVYAAAFVLITLISLFYKLFLSGTFDGNAEPEVIKADETETVYEIIQTEDTHRDTVSVYICGEVNSPGVYELEAGSIINDAVIMAGGFTSEASVNRIDLVCIIDSNLSVYIPSVNEEDDDSEIIRDEDQLIWGSGIDGGSTGSTDLVNINTASREQIMTLPGIGEVTADAIIEYREQNPFERIEDIMNVQGIGEAKFNSIRDLICV